MYNPINSTQWRMILIDLSCAFLYAGVPLLIAMYHIYLSPPDFIVHLKWVPHFVYDKILLIIPNTTTDAVTLMAFRWTLCGVAGSIMHFLLAGFSLSCNGFHLHGLLFPSLFSYFLNERMISLTHTLYLSLTHTLLLNHSLTLSLSFSLSLSFLFYLSFSLRS